MECICLQLVYSYKNLETERKKSLFGSRKVFGKDNSTIWVSGSLKVLAFKASTQGSIKETMNS